MEKIQVIKMLMRYKRNGFSFFNTGSNKKKVVTPWKEYTKRKPTDKEIKNWLNKPYQNYATVAGKISNIIVFDLDSYKHNNENPHHQLFLDVDTFTIKTPSGGHHVYFKYTEKLSDIIHSGKGILKNIDLQTNNSLLFAPPSDFGKGTYEIAKDKPIIDIPQELLDKVLDQLTADVAKSSNIQLDYKPKATPLNLNSTRPGDILNTLATWEQILLPHGWQIAYKKEPTTYWVRPNKDKRGGISASTNYHDYDLFFCYSSSVSPIIPKKGYTKFNLYTLLSHNEDYKKAAQHLVMSSFNLNNHD